MGMTIGEHITQLKKLKSFHNGSYGASINFALDTMKKYQKIQEIVNSKTTRLSYEEGFRQIKEVIEDDND